MGMQEHADDIAQGRSCASLMGGDEAVARQHAAGKLTVLERIERLFDQDTFTELGIHATHAGIAPDLAGRETPADGVVTGFGKVDGRPASVIDPRDTRPPLIRALEMAKTKRVDRPCRKHGVMPV
jgi:acetyl-CoA carboxylase carboxyltransferase component